MIETAMLQQLQAALGSRVQIDAPLAPFSAARIGGPADVLVTVRNAAELAQAARLLFATNQPFVVIGGGSNVLVSDAGVRGVVILNRADAITFDAASSKVCAESGASLGLIARLAAAEGLSGLEWAAGIPGTLGGAIVGNAGAHGADMTGNLLMAEILHHDGSMQNWSLDDMQYAYRSSALKRQAGRAVVIRGQLALQPGDKAAIQARMTEYRDYRKRTQPPGASMGSMFKNPVGDYAGRLIEAAGLKGTRIGGAMVSPVHANFFINETGATASDLFNLINLVRQRVADHSGVTLELEIELIGEWPA